MTYKNIVTSEWLKDHLTDSSLVIVDCRFQLGQPTKGKKDYMEEHLPGSIYMDLEKDLSAPITKHGGRHPLPSVEQASQVFSNAGIDNSKKVIAYDDQGGAMAAHLWWLLKYLGHKEVFVLNETFTHWKEKGYPTTRELPTNTPTSFTSNVQDNLVLTMEEVKEKLGDTNVIFVDSRAEDRYLGKNEPIDPVAGHIPGAVNEDWQQRLSAKGTWLSKEELEKSLQQYKAEKEKELIVYCGSGVTACANILAFQEIGLQPKLYAGSWSDWITYEENPIETGRDGSNREKNYKKEW